jgi:hypothetical protein
MEKSTPVSKTTNKPITPEMQQRLNEFHKKIGQSMVDTLNYNTTHPDAPHRKGK